MRSSNWSVSVPLQDLMELSMLIDEVSQMKEQLHLVCARVDGLHSQLYSALELFVKKP